MPWGPLPLPSVTDLRWQGAEREVPSEWLMTDAIVRLVWLFTESTVHKTPDID